MEIPCQFQEVPPVVVEIEYGSGCGEVFKMSKAEFEGLKLYWDRHPQLPYHALTRIYLGNLRRGIDLLKMPAPSPSKEQTGGAA